MAFIRAIFKQLLADAKDPRITILQGSRQVGKTYLLKLLSKKLKNDHYFNLEESDDLRLFNADDKAIVD
ncbi:MAG: AAA family ATPase, partial [Candidatus Melainabacteria bacterium]|nr:AAA family ATPase [Candidatus Melainabacteria bacterium]